MQSHNVLFLFLTVSPWCSHGFPNGLRPSVCVSSQAPKAVVRLVQVRHGGPRHRRGAEGVHGLGDMAGCGGHAPMACRFTVELCIFVV